MTQAFDLGAIPNQLRNQYRNRVNENIQALATNNSGISAPNPSYPLMMWYDVGTGKVKMRDAANTSWVIIGDIGPPIKWLTSGDRINVLHYGAKGDGITDDTAAINNAITAMPAAGGRLCFPAGTYKVSSTITLNKPGVYYGDGFSTVIKTSNASQSVFDATVASVTVSDILFDSSVTRTGGAYVKVSAGDFRMQKFWMYHAYIGIQIIDGISLVSIDSGHLRDGIATTGVGVLINGGTAIYLRDLLMDNVPGIAASIRITKGSDISICDCGLLRAAVGLEISCSGGNIVSDVAVCNTFLDTCGDAGASFLASGSGTTIVRVILEQTWFSSAANIGMSLSTASSGLIDGVDINGCHALFNGSIGLNVADSGVHNLRVLGGAYSGNGTAGLAFANGVNDFSVIGVRAGASHGAPTQSYGIFIAGTSNTNYMVVNSDFRGNSITGLVDGGTGTKVVKDNL